MKKLKNFFLSFLVKKLQKQKNLLHVETPKILIVTTTGLGDSLWATPTLIAIKEKYPKAYLGILTSSLGKEIFINNPYVDKIFTFPSSLSFFLLSLYRKLRKEKFEIIFLYHTSQRIVPAFCCLLGAQKIIGFANQQKGLDHLLTKKIEKKQEHEILSRFHLLEEIQIAKNNNTLCFFPLFSSKQKVASYISSFSNKKKIVIHPGSQNHYKCWPKELFIKLCDSFFQDSTVQLFLSGAKQELSLLEEIKHKSKSEILLLYDWSLHDLGSFFYYSDLVIANDTGPAHLAMSVNTKLLMLFCPTDPILYGPYNNANAHVIASLPSCSFCLKRKCRDPFCWMQISVDTVLDKAKKILAMEKICK